MKIQRQPLPDTHCLHATTRVEPAPFEVLKALIQPYSADALGCVVEGRCNKLKLCARKLHANVRVLRSGMIRMPGVLVQD